MQYRESSTRWRSVPAGGGGGQDQTWVLTRHLLPRRDRQGGWRRKVRGTSIPVLTSEKVGHEARVTPGVFPGQTLSVDSGDTAKRS